ncbi:MAG: class I SAM-dependent methyltransferase [Gemmatimonas sp.]
MSEAVTMKGGGHHDWNSADYVDGWMAKDRNREERRRPLLAKMMTLVPFAHDQVIRVLDVGGGYGAVSSFVLDTFPNARVTLQDYSAVMLERAQHHFAGRRGPDAYVRSDLTDPAWVTSAGGPYDLVVSAIAIHNLGDADVFQQVYRAIHDLLVPGGWFIDCDHFGHSGGVLLHLELLAKAGFDTTECPVEESKTGIARARRPY